MSDLPHYGGSLVLYSPSCVFYPENRLFPGQKVFFQHFIRKSAFFTDKFSFLSVLPPHIAAVWGGCRRLWEWHSAKDCISMYYKNNISSHLGYTVL